MREDRRWREEKRERVEMLTQPHSQEASSKVEVKEVGGGWGWGGINKEGGSRSTPSAIFPSLTKNLEIRLQANETLRGGRRAASVLRRDQRAIGPSEADHDIAC